VVEEFPQESSVTEVAVENLIRELLGHANHMDEIEAVLVPVLQVAKEIQKIAQEFQEFAQIVQVGKDKVGNTAVLAVEQLVALVVGAVQEEQHVVEAILGIREGDQEMAQLLH
jgi:hypothetical protein